MKYDLPPWADPSNPALLQAIEYQRWLNEQLAFVCGFWDKDESGRPLDEVHKEQYEFAQSVYLAIDWPTELPLNFRM